MVEKNEQNTFDQALKVQTEEDRLVIETVNRGSSKSSVTHPMVIEHLPASGSSTDE